MTNQTNNGGLTKVASDRAVWERPALNRLDAADAEFMGGRGGDSTQAERSRFGYLS